jgi:leucyl aminopeptidase
MGKTQNRDSRTMAETIDLIQPDRGQDAISIHLVARDGFEAWAKQLSNGQRSALAAQKFEGGGYQTAIVPDGDGWFAVGGVANPAELSSWCMAKLAEDLPAGTYRRAEGEPGPALHGWQTAQYTFERYKQPERPTGPRVLLTKEAGKIDPAIAEARAVGLVRDLVNTGAGDLGPAELEMAVEKLAREHHAALTVTRGDTLAADYPMIHAVGQAAVKERHPRLIELEWGDPAHPRIALVGKGVVFDTGGLDIKPSAGMRLMKKDMGGAAHALALAGLVMAARLPVRLHLLIPAVENAIAGNAFRPGDVLRSRAGLTVENTNTDAEGRLILGDALTKAGEGKPELILDFATLTGAARVALGPDLPPLFTDDAAMPPRDSADRRADAHDDDPLWRHAATRAPTATWLNSDIADTNNAPDGNGFAGASRGRAVPPPNSCGEGRRLGAFGHSSPGARRAKPGRPKGGEAYGLRAAWHMLQERYGSA